jgi:TctA family transporter
MLNSSSSELMVMIVFGIIGCIFRKLDCQLAPLLLCLVLGALLEENSGAHCGFSDGDWLIFITRPLSTGFLIASVALLVIVAPPSVQRNREESLRE